MSKDEPRWLYAARLWVKMWQGQTYSEEHPMPVAEQMAIKLLAHADELRSMLGEVCKGVFRKPECQCAICRAKDLLEREDPPEVSCLSTE